jgi:DNA-binding NarL/FixJ family response regulator
MSTAPVRDRTIRIAVRSHRRLFRDALAMCLQAEPGYDVVGHAADLGDLLALCGLRQPDVVLIDLCGDAPPGEDLAALRACVEHSRVVVVYDELAPADLARLWGLGVDTLVPSSHGLAALLVVLQRYLDRRDVAPARPAVEGLTEREREILTLVGAGHTVDRIADLLQLSPSAVANAKRRIYNKLAVDSQSQAVARAATLGILARPGPPPRRPGGAVGAVVSVRGAEGPSRQQVTAALLGGRMPFTVGANDGPGPDRPRIMVLVDPEPGDWPAERDSAAPIVLVRSGAPRRAEMVAALLRGAIAVVNVERIATDLVPALTLATKGYLAVESGAAGALLEALRGPAMSRGPGMPELTARECDILRSIADGHTVRQTARLLGIAEKTVENTQGHLFRKLGARNRSGALSAAHALGLLEQVSRPS